MRLHARGDAGVWAALALACGAPAPDRAVLEASRELDDVRGLDDPFLFPGGMRYGGLDAFLPLCAPCPLRVVRDRPLPPRE